MSVCEKCGKEFLGSKYVVRRFCSRGCANDAHKWIPRKKRTPTGKCSDCGVSVRVRKKRCVECRIKLRAGAIKRRRASSSRRVTEWRRRAKLRAVEYKGGKCVRCGYNKSIWALQFHHRDPNEKDFSISKPNPRAWEKLKIELDKCDLVCANCHSEIHDDLFADVGSSN